MKGAAALSRIAREARCALIGRVIVNERVVGAGVAEAARAETGQQDVRVPRRLGRATREAAEDEWPIASHSPARGTWTPP